MAVQRLTAQVTQRVTSGSSAWLAAEQLCSAACTPDGPYILSMIAILQCFDTFGWVRALSRIFGPIANLKGPYFQPSLSVCL